MRTLWGRADQRRVLDKGVYLVSTPSHGGIMLGQRAADHILCEVGREWNIGCQSEVEKKLNIQFTQQNDEHEKDEEEES